jgi:PAS domain S-box-containing protein
MHTALTKWLGCIGRCSRSIAFRYFAACGLVALALWAAVFLALQATHERIADNASVERRNLARSIAEHVASSVRAIDLSLLHLRDAWTRDPRSFPAAVTRFQKFLNAEKIDQVSILDAAGHTVYKTHALPDEDDLSREPCFKIHQEHGHDELYISKPVLNRQTGRWTIHFTRSMHDRRGRFAGVVVISMFPPELGRAYNDIQLGEGASISLLRADGRFIARSQNLVRSPNAPLALIDAPVARPGDPIAGEVRRASAVDGIDSLITYRKVSGYPLLVHVRQPVDTVFAPYYAQRRNQLLVGTLATALLLLFALVLVHRRRDHEKAAQTHVRLAAMVNSANDAIISRDLDDKVVSWNAAAERLLGYSAAEVLGKDITPMVTPPALLPELMKYREMRRAGMILPSYDTVRVAKDGRHIAMSVSVSPIKDARGETIGSSVVWRDIREREATEAQQRLAASVFDNATEGIVVTDRDNNIISVNRAFTVITGYSAEEVMGANVRLGGGKHDPVSHEEMWAMANRTGNWEGEIWDKRKNGDLFCALVSISAIRNGAGEMVRHSIIFMDITGRKQAEAALLCLNQELEDRVAQRTAALEFANRELEAFSYSVSHDLRAPLRAINGFAALILKDCRDRLDTALYGNLQRIWANSERMGELIDDLLSLTRVSRQEVRRQDFDFSVLAGKVAAALAEAHPQRKVHLTVQSDARAHADRGLVQVVLENLVGNAWKFTANADTARIEVGVERRANKTTYYVRDNGAGFDMDYAHKLFKPFQRLHSREEFEGTGIGLSIVQRIVTKHGGEIWAESVKGQGTVFLFTLE